MQGISFMQEMEAARLSPNVAAQGEKTRKLQARRQGEASHHAVDAVDAGGITVG